MWFSTAELLVPNHHQRQKESLRGVTLDIISVQKVQVAKEYLAMENEIDIISQDVVDTVATSVVKVKAETYR